MLKPAARQPEGSAVWGQRTVLSGYGAAVTHVTFSFFINTGLMIHLTVLRLLGKRKTSRPPAPLTSASIPLALAGTGVDSGGIKVPLSRQTHQTCCPTACHQDHKVRCPLGDRASHAPALTCVAHRSIHFRSALDPEWSQSLTNSFLRRRLLQCLPRRCEESVFLHHLPACWFPSMLRCRPHSPPTCA